MEHNVLKMVYESINKGEKVALATITRSSGSTPRKTGAIMAVWKDGNIAGSIGGGKIEFEVIKKSIECIKKEENAEFRYNLSGNGELGMQCGGEAEGFIKLFKPITKLIIAGAGHIGSELHKLAKMAGFYTVVVDDRDEYANKENIKDCDEILAGDIYENLSSYNIDENNYVVIATKGHDTDLKALKAVINKNPKYIGMIGSRRKKKIIMDELLSLGVKKETLDKVYSPIGLNICSGTPEEIAFGILAEILVIKNNGTLQHRRDM